MPKFDREPAKRDSKHQTPEKQFSLREKSLKKSWKVQLSVNKQALKTNIDNQKQTNKLYSGS